MIYTEDLRKGNLTRAKILYYIYKTGPSQATSVAKLLGISAQAVHSHLQNMIIEGLVSKEKKGYVITQNGLNALIHIIMALRNFVSEVMQSLKDFNTVEAIAACEIKRNDQVKIYMENGIVYASKEDKTLDNIPKGTALNHALRGEPVLVTDVSSMMDIGPGHLYVVVLYTIDLSSIKRPLTLKLKELNVDYIGAYGTAPYGILTFLGFNVDFKFASIASCVEASAKGMNCAIVTTHNTLPYVLLGIERECEFWGKKLRYDIVTVG